MRPVLIKATLPNAPRFQSRLIAMCLSLVGLASFAQENPPSRGRDVTKLYTPILCQLSRNGYGGRLRFEPRGRRLALWRR